MSRVAPTASLARELRGGDVILSLDGVAVTGGVRQVRRDDGVARRRIASMTRRLRVGSRHHDEESSRPRRLNAS